MHLKMMKHLHVLDHKTIKITAGLMVCVIMSGCQPKTEKREADAVQTQTHQAQQLNSGSNHYIESKTVPLKPKQARVCDEQGCMDYRFQTVATNQPWINDYFKQRIEKADPLPFVTSDQDARVRDAKPQELSETEVMVRFIGQNQHLATFEYTTNVYSAGAAHGMYHNEYVNFDLKAKKRIALEDLMEAGTRTKLRDTLFETNSNWLNAQSIEKAKLEVSDNFYYGADGIVFVYPLYELAAYSEGMSELTLPYHYTQKLIKPKYLPNLPHYAQN